jgi:hypothetical protein
MAYKLTSLSGITSRGWVSSEKDVVKWFESHDNNIFSREIPAKSKAPVKYLFNKRIILVANGMAISDEIIDDSIEKVKPGDIICRNGNVSILDIPLYIHYGIFVDNNEVVHYAPKDTPGNPTKNLILDGPKNAVIHSVTLDKFLNGNYLIIDNEYKPLKYNQKQTIERAKSKINSNKGEYNLLSHNCEHFASWCMTGKSQSKQVEAGGGIIKIGGYVIGGLTGNPAIGIITNKVIDEIKSPKDF